MSDSPETSVGSSESTRLSKPGGSTRNQSSKNREIDRVRTITAKGIAELLEVSVYTVHRRKKLGHFPMPIKGSSNPELWNRGAINLYLESIGLKVV